MIAMPKALIFDFDGVIVLSEEARFRVLQQIAQRYDVQINDDLFNDIIGRTTKYFFSATLPDVDQTVLDKILADNQKEYKDKIVDHVVPVAAMTDFIRDYIGPKLLAVASGSTAAVLNTVLSYIGIFEKFACVTGQEHVTRHKPDPEVYNLTASQLGCSNEDCIVIEDSLVGAQAAINAGMKVYIFLNGVNSKAEFSDVNVAGFLETAEQIRQALV
jgi:beta-phosphoglucomutase